MTSNLCLLRGLSMLALFFSTSLCAQPPDGPRGIWPEEFKRQRASPGKPTQINKQTPAQQAPPAPEVAFVGLTLWRLRQSTDTDQVRVFLHETGTANNGAITVTPERVSMNTPLSEGDRLRLGIEATASGYLYVFSQEQYADGSTGDPYILFPSKRIYDGRHDVRAGLALEIPDSHNRVPYLTLKKSRPDHVREILTILVTPKPLPHLISDGESTRMQRAEFEEIRKLWPVFVESVEVDGAAGKPMTSIEADSIKGKALLQYSDPLPSSIYQVHKTEGQPMLVSVSLHLRQ